MLLEEDERRRESTLQIASAHGETTAVRFHQMALPKDVGDLHI